MNATENPPEFIGIAKAARMLGVAQLTLRHRIERGELTAFKHPMDDRYRLLRKSDLDALKATQPVVEVYRAPRAPRTRKAA